MVISNTRRINIFFFETLKESEVHIVKGGRPHYLSFSVVSKKNIVRTMTEVIIVIMVKFVFT